MIVIDASVLVIGLLDDDDEGRRVRARLAGEDLAAPELIDLEVASAVRRLVQHGDLPERRAEQALQDLVDLPLRRSRHAPLVARCWELRANLTPYDAAYVALAEVLEVTLLTTDRRLSRAPGPFCQLEVLT